jgi:drug/metabolite transporter (DMT)-like permease
MITDLNQAPFAKVSSWSGCFKKYGRRNMTLAFCAGALSYGVASVSYAAAMQLIGAGKTVLITALAPIFILPF